MAVAARSWHRTGLGTVLASYLINLPRSADTAVHAVDDIVLQASGAGAERFHGYMEQSDVYRVVVDALALGTATN